MFDYQPLSAQYLSGTVLVSHPSQSKSVTLESSALEVMTDLRHNNACCNRAICAHGICKFIHDTVWSTFVTRTES